MYKRIVAAALLVLSVVALSSAEVNHGTWVAEAREPGKVHLAIFSGRGNLNGSEFDIAQLRGLAVSAVNGSNEQVRFQLQREAGTLDFSGRFERRRGKGTFTFTPDPSYATAMKSLGFQVAHKQLEMALIDVTTGYTKELLALGYKPNLEALIEARIFNVDREQVEGLKSIGVDHPSLDKLVEFRIFNVTPEYVRQMRAAGFDQPLDALVQFRIHEVTPEFKKQMAAAGYPNVSADDLVAFRIHGVTTDYINQMRKLGYTNLSADDLVQFRIFNVNEEQIRDMANAGYKNLSAEQLVELRVHGIDSRFVERAKEAGYAHPTIDQLEEMKIRGFRAYKRDAEDDSDPL